ncbi:membrane protein [Leptolyngbya sp. Heron Island J]|uniref:TIGR00341 family protein n=1 Tax=Leptolyngbya sp. Heron Island J TaxID=1385935 RepID=UPI0003B98252|nr:TIGR00341 family protein [Leptolyngbya sp. Heron Island J]ESA35135.1 membrane protein [Leptolyngbya sp. Heron Island J]
MVRDGLQALNHRYFGGRRVSPMELKHMRDSLMDDSELNRDYVVMTIGACIIATLGLLSNSAAVIIGAMLVAPLMLPIRGLAFGFLEGDIELIKEGAKALGIGTVIAIALSTSLGFMLGLSEYGSEVWARSEPTLLDLGIAITAGGISGFAKVQPKISSTLAGTAIAVALMPPVCVIGLGLAQGRMALSEGAVLLYVTNLIGITLACMLAFWLSGYALFQKARKSLRYALIFTAALVVPLGISLVELVRQNRAEDSVRDALVNGTVTFQRLELIDSNIDWLASPPEVRLTVYSTTEVTPTQVGLLEDYVSRRMRREFRLIFEVSEVQEVTREEVQPASAEPVSEE